ncbi:MAG: hypothetical protein JWM07_527 [Candidatus Saccharibacteria bacterium]|nr:hypothetical protein [Candidatus Saccharibacteria bacterium]
MNNKLTPLGQQFIASLTHSRALVAEQIKADATAEKVHVVGGGGAIIAAYEQFRNAAEYTEEHLLLQRAIRRYYKRLFLSQDRTQLAHSAEELIVELTLAGYLANDSIPHKLLKTVDELAQLYFDAHMQLHTSAHFKDAWTLDVLSVRIEDILHNLTDENIFAQLCFDHFIATIDMSTFAKDANTTDTEAALFVAVHRSLLRSGDATIRASLLDRYQLTPRTVESYVAVNHQIDLLFDADITDKLLRVVTRRGAPLRVFRHMLANQDNVDTLLQSRANFLSNFEAQIAKEYESVAQRINRGIIKSVIFLIITKVIIGLAIEVPYDYAVHGSIIVLPLLINLLFPPLYMILLRLTLVLPGYANTAALVDRIDAIFYGEPAQYLARRRGGRFGVAFNIVYAAIIIGVFGLASWWLITLGFSFLHLLIFFVFLSTASFLGFRLSRMVREIEVVDADQNGITLLRDVLYMPFVVVGRWISEKYAKVNLVATLLDIMIELPLKTVLRLVRQWGAFISSKKDEL